MNKLLPIANLSSFPHAFPPQGFGRINFRLGREFEKGNVKRGELL